MPSRSEVQQSQAMRASGRGFTYLGVLFLIALLGATAAMASVVWSTVQRRANERELVFVGRQFQHAIDRYRQGSKDAELPYPRHLEDLLRDTRAPGTRRYLRQLYPDPMSGDKDWGLIRLPDGSIVGVYSLSEREPLQRAALGHGLAFPDAKTYRDWRFIAPSAAELLAPAR